MFSNSRNIAEVAIIYWRKLNCLLRILKIRALGSRGRRWEEHMLCAGGVKNV
jgi:hypothetical protein